MTNQDFITPLGSIVYMNLTKPDQNGFYKVCLSFEQGAEGVQEMLDTITAINPKTIVDTNVNPNVPSGHVQIKFKTKYNPNVLNEAGEEMAEGSIPTFTFETDSGQAVVRAKVSTAGKNPTFYLQDVRLVNLDVKPREGSQNAQAIRGDLQAIHNS